MPAQTAYPYSPATREGGPHCETRPSCHSFQALALAPKSHHSPKIRQGLLQLAARRGPCHGSSSRSQGYCGCCGSRSEGGLSTFAHPLSLTPPFLPLLQLIKEKLLDLLGKEEDEGSHDENVVRVDCGL